MEEFIEIKTKYGMLNGVTRVEWYENGQPKECMLEKRNEITTIAGILIPQYSDDEVRRKYSNSLTFYNNGNLKSIALQEQSDIKTAIGSLKAELVTFYESGSIKRVFPLNGKITGYWSEENEYELATNQEISFEFGTMSKKLIGILFYETGEIKGITLWPKERIVVPIKGRKINVRTGIVVYQNGAIKSIEPAQATDIKTPIGVIRAYDINGIGINGDKNSLSFYEDGTIKSITTSTDRIEIEDETGKFYFFEPGLKPSLFHEDRMDIIPLIIEFEDNKVYFYEKQYEFDFRKSAFTIKTNYMAMTNKCNNCDGCNACG